MSDLSDVEAGIVNVIANSVFPAISYIQNTVQASTIFNAPVKIMRGWPIDNILNRDLTAGVTNISVYSLPGVSKPTIFLKQPQIFATSRADATMTATVHNNTVTFSGTGSATQVIGVAAPPQFGYAYRLRANDTPTSVASAFAANLPNASSSGAVLTINIPLTIRADVGTDTTLLQEVGRQDQMFEVTVWAPTVALRDQITSFIDPNIRNCDQMRFTDGSCSGPIRTGNGTVSDDCTQKQNLWKRSLYYWVNYATNLPVIQPAMVLGISTKESTPISYV